jgi:hypothetical protein
MPDETSLIALYDGASNTGVALCMRLDPTGDRDLKARVIGMALLEALEERNEDVCRPQGSGNR